MHKIYVVRGMHCVLNLTGDKEDSDPNNNKSVNFKARNKNHSKQDSKTRF